MLIVRRWAVVVVVLLVSGSGCAITPGPSITKEEAMTVVNGYLQETFRAVPAPAPFTIERPLLTTSCEYPLDTGPTGQITPGTEYLIERIKEKKARKYLDDVAMYWHRKPGTRVEWHIQKDGATDRVMVRFKRPGNYWLAVDYYPYSEVGTLNIAGGVWDCIWENGTAPPEPDVFSASE